MGGKKLINNFKALQLLCYSIMIKGAWGEILHCYLLAQRPCENYLYPLWLRFFICKMVITIIIQGC